MINMTMYILNSDGKWSDIGDIWWSSVIERNVSEIPDKLFNENGIRIFKDACDEIFIYREVKECAI